MFLVYNGKEIYDLENIYDLGNEYSTVCVGLEGNSFSFMHYI